MWSAIVRLAHITSCATRSRQSPKLSRPLPSVQRRLAYAGPSLPWPSDRHVGVQRARVRLDVPPAGLLHPLAARTSRGRTRARRTTLPAITNMTRREAVRGEDLVGPAVRVEPAVVERDQDRPLGQVLGVAVQEPDVLLDADRLEAGLLEHLHLLGEGALGDRVVVLAAVDPVVGEHRDGRLLRHRQRAPLRQPLQRYLELRRVERRAAPPGSSLAPVSFGTARYSGSRDSGNSRNVAALRAMRPARVTMTPPPSPAVRTWSPSSDCGR